MISAVICGQSCMSNLKLPRSFYRNFVSRFGGNAKCCHTSLLCWSTRLNRSARIMFKVKNQQRWFYKVYPYLWFAFRHLTLSWGSKLNWVSFHVSSTLVCQSLLVAQFIETSTTKRVFHCYRPERDVHLFCKFRTTFTCTRNIEKSSYHDRTCPVIVRNELRTDYFFFKFEMMTDTTKLYMLIPVWMTLTSAQGHAFRRKLARA